MILGHEAKPKSAKGRPDRPAPLGNAHLTDDSASIDETLIRLLAMTRRQKGIGLGARRTRTREHRPCFLSFVPFAWEPGSASFFKLGSEEP
jgi:hypothetical protein